jgi:Protein of unknown function (DUF4244)
MSEVATEMVGGGQMVLAVTAAGAVPRKQAGVDVGAGRDQRGMVSAEWAVGIIAAVAVAGVLLAVVTNGLVRSALLQFILQLIHTFSGKIV